MADVSLSTMWAQGRFQHFGDFVSAVRRMGFDGIEINYTVEPPGLEELLADGNGAYPSFHSPVPRLKARDGRWSDELNLASPDEEERRQAVAAAITTLDWAAKVGAGRVVVHLGGVGGQMLPADGDLEGGAPLAPGRVDVAEVRLGLVRRPLEHRRQSEERRREQ